MSTAHGWTGQSARERYLYYPAGKRLLTRFPRVIAVSSDIRNELDPHGVPREPDHGDPERDRSRTRSRATSTQSETPCERILGLRTDDVVIGAVGRLERQKRFDLLIEAFAPLARSRPALRLVIVGDGSLRSELAAQA